MLRAALRSELTGRADAGRSSWLIWAMAAMGPISAHPVAHGAKSAVFCAAAEDLEGRGGELLGEGGRGVPFQVWTRAISEANAARAYAAMEAEVVRAAGAPLPSIEELVAAGGGGGGGGGA
jgi:hypothetical protein